MVKQYQVRLSAQAQASLQHIVDYLTEKSSLQSALKMERKLLLAIQSLKTFPGGYGELKIKRKKNDNPYRFLPESSYKIIYTVEEVPDAVVIVIELVHDSRSMKRVDKMLP
jgi:plasmid stabilization system protein ParE